MGSEKSNFGNENKKFYYSLPLNGISRALQYLKYITCINRFHERLKSLQKLR